MPPAACLLFPDMAYVLCLDCGATNVRAILVDDKGQLVAKSSQPNSTDAGSENPDFHVWNADRILNQLATCAREILHLRRGWRPGERGR